MQYKSGSLADRVLDEKDTCVVVELFLVHVDDVGADAVHEVLGVGDHEQDALELAEHIFQPHTSLQVQMVGRLVQDAAHRNVSAQGE